MSELEAFKSTINLSEYAASCGYEWDRKVSSRNSLVMRHRNGDKIIIACGTDGHWIYFSVRDDSDNGTIIDFVQRRQGCTLGKVRQVLRPWVGRAGERPPRPQPGRFAREIETISKDRAGILLAYSRMQPLTHHVYLEQERHIPAAVLQSIRFAGKVMTDAHNNAIFPHHDQDGVCGYEIKNQNFTGFSKGGEKGLWFSAAHKGDTRLVIAESAIDAISYHILHPDEHTRCASIGGKLNSSQPALICSAVERMPAGAEIILAMDADDGGRKLAGVIEEIAREVGQGKAVIKDLPLKEGSDWNDQLKKCQLGRSEAKMSRCDRSPGGSIDCA